MPTQEAIQALLELRRKQQQNTTAPSGITDYNFDKPNETVNNLIQNFSSQSQRPTQQSPTSDNIGKNLLQAVGVGLYDFGEAWGFEISDIVKIEGDLENIS